MKKSLITLVTLALVLVNLVLTGVMALRIVPEITNVNNLIGRISQAIDLDIASGDEFTGSSNVSIQNITPWPVPDKLTINLRKDVDGQQHFAVISVTLSLNNNSEKFAEYSDLTPYAGIIENEIISVVSSYTMDELRDDIEGCQKAIRDRLNTLFEGDLVAAVAFSSINYQ